MKLNFTLLAVFCFCAIVWAESPDSPGVKRMKQVEHLGSFQVIELRRYIIKAGERDNFAKYFDSYFPEAFEQLGAIAAGQCFERKQETNFFWLRGFHDMDDRAKINSLFYYGPLWKEHRETMNSLMIDSDNVLLLKPVDPSRPIRILPAVDPVRELQGAQGVAVVQIFPVKPGDVDAFVANGGKEFEKYVASGAQEIGLLETLDAKNNFPQLPVRTDGPFVVWIGMLRDDRQLRSGFNDLAEHTAKKLGASGYLRGEPETVILDPTLRSRMRWMPE